MVYCRTNTRRRQVSELPFWWDGQNRVTEETEADREELAHLPYQRPSASEQAGALAMRWVDGSHAAVNLSSGQLAVGSPWTFGGLSSRLAIPSRPGTGPKGPRIARHGEIGTDRCVNIDEGFHIAVVEGLAKTPF